MDEEVEMTMDAFDLYLDTLTIRELQTECARAISTMPADNNSIHKFNKKAHHNSHLWYKAVIKFYIEEHGDFPSQCGPGKDIKMILDD